MHQYKIDTYASAREEKFVYHLYLWKEKIWLCSSSSCLSVR